MHKNSGRSTALFFPVIMNSTTSFLKISDNTPYQNLIEKSSYKRQHNKFMPFSRMNFYIQTYMQILQLQIFLHLGHYHSSDLTASSTFSPYLPCLSMCIVTMDRSMKPQNPKSIWTIFSGVTMSIILGCITCSFSLRKQWISMTLMMPML